MSETAEVLCCCGRALHYGTPDARALVENLVKAYGEVIPVSDSANRTWLVPRHYIALHGLKEQNLATLAIQYGWSEVPDGR